MSSLSPFSHQTLVLIGGSSGIGLRVAEQVAAPGVVLVIVGRNAERLAGARERLGALGAQVATEQVDAHDHAALESLFERLPAFDHLVSMVGDVMGGGFLANDMSTIRRSMESKFFTNVRIGQLAARRVRDGGSLVFTSGVGRVHQACAAVIGNLAINAMVQGLAVELAPRVRVNAVSPTWTDTPFWRDMPAAQREALHAQVAQGLPLRRTARIDELAQAYVFLMANGFVTGQHLDVDGGAMLGA